MIDTKNLMRVFLDSQADACLQIATLIEDYRKAAAAMEEYAAPNLALLRRKLSSSTDANEKAEYTRRLHDLELVAANDRHPRQFADRQAMSKVQADIFKAITLLVPKGTAFADKVLEAVAKDFRELYARYGETAPVQTAIHANIDAFKRQVNLWPAEMERHARFSHMVVTLGRFGSLFSPPQAPQNAARGPWPEGDLRYRRQQMDAEQQKRDAEEDAKKQARIKSGALSAFRRLRRNPPTSGMTEPKETVNNV